MAASGPAMKGLGEAAELVAAAGAEVALQADTQTRVAWPVTPEPGHPQRRGRRPGRGWVAGDGQPGNREPAPQGEDGLDQVAGVAGPTDGGRVVAHPAALAGWTGELAAPALLL